MLCVYNFVQTVSVWISLLIISVFTQKSKHSTLTYSFVSNYRQLSVDKLLEFGTCAFLPMTLLAKEALFSVAKPRSPIFTEPVGPVMKMLSHLRSL